jgi:hypothetical protein
MADAPKDEQRPKTTTPTMKPDAKAPKWEELAAQLKVSLEKHLTDDRLNTLVAIIPSEKRDEAQKLREYCVNAAYYLKLVNGEDPTAENT